MNSEEKFSQRDLRKTTEYWTETRAKKLIQTGKSFGDKKYELSYLNKTRFVFDK